ncbi:aminoglycoside phosphotransferase family protein [Kineococcus sp. NBC_00420]|uniref:aminoglycoside phosphotransferase family protein n=1 Tax=Kineococcus sp. NBC_00420 TaxID=2903564 RepID=UPI002E219B0D
MNADEEVTTPQLEVALEGGNMGGAVRVGTTVRRPAGPWTATVQRLLQHLHEHGLNWTPQPLGRDERGRDITSHLPGTVPSYPLPPWVWTDEVLIRATEFLAQLHEVSATFNTEDASWQLPTHEPAEVVCHNDFDPYNMVFEDQQLSGVIDWDTASPGPRVWDVAYMAYRLVPLTDPDTGDGLPNTLSEKARRLRLVCKTYGQDLDPARVVSVAVDRIRDLAAFTQARADAGHEHLHAHVSTYHQDAAWITANAQHLRAEEPDLPD